MMQVISNSNQFVILSLILGSMSLATLAMEESATAFFDLSLLVQPKINAILDDDNIRILARPSFNKLDLSIRPFKIYVGVESDAQVTVTMTGLSLLGPDLITRYPLIAIASAQEGIVEGTMQQSFETGGTITVTPSTTMSSSDNLTADNYSFVFHLQQLKLKKVNNFWLRGDYRGTLIITFSHSL